jgi:primosomal protein N' (replication factor Y)
MNTVLAFYSTETTPVTQRELFPSSEESPQAPAAPVSLFADVVFDRPLDHAYTYGVPDQLLGAVAVGGRVLAPFGKGDRPTAGFCVGLTDKIPSVPVKSLIRGLDDRALVTPELMRLTRWMADYYLCGWGQVLNAVIPAGVKERAGTRLATFLQAVAEAFLPEPIPRLSAKQRRALEELRSANEPVEARLLAQRAQCGVGPVLALADKKLARRFVRRVEVSDELKVMSDELSDHSSLIAHHSSLATVIELNADQLQAWKPIEQALKQGGYHAFLLHGVTGSGKTEIYLRAMEEVIRQGKEVLILVPEISLTPQTIERFRGRCQSVAVLHSHLGSAERGGHWRRVAAGQVQVVVGARSAVFAPTRKLGLIVIDEEHEGSFKQESTPRYHARDVAVMRARLQEIPIILGSATPSLESWHNAERENYTILKLPNRVLDLSLPQVGLIDLRHERMVATTRFSAISPALERAMRDTLRDKGQVMLLLNRRGFSTHVHCPSCGHVESCLHCDLALTYHRQSEKMLCHYCGYKQDPAKVCPKCSKMEIRYQGLGTEKLLAEIEERFPGVVVRRMDSDSMRRPGSHGRILSAFRRGLIDILLGTQMIAKGLDFPNVMLVGVVNADMGLHIPDFRSAERTFQLLSQVAGRAGRGPRGGRVLVQTFNPDQPCVFLAAQHDYETFAKLEMAHRGEHHYPPYQRLARLIIRSKKADKAAAFADRLAADFQHTMKVLRLPGEVRLLGPAEAPVFRLKGYCRFHFQLQAASAAALHQLLRTVLSASRPPAGVEFTLDVDPLNML